ERDSICESTVSDRRRIMRAIAVFLRVILMTTMLIWFLAFCIVFIVVAINLLRDMFTSHGINMLRSLALFAAELCMASMYGLSACATLMGWKTRNRWGVVGSLLSICVPLSVLYWGASMFWRYLIISFWPFWLIGVIGTVLFWNGGP